MKRKAYKRKSPELSKAEIEARRKGGMARSRKKTRACRLNARLTAGVPRPNRSDPDKGLEKLEARIKAANHEAMQKRKKTCPT